MSDTPQAAPRLHPTRRARVRRRLLGPLLALGLVGGLLTGTSPAFAEREASLRGVDRTVTVTPDLTRYVALGDSYTSAPLVPVSDPANGCFRSSNNYPHVLARTLGLQLEDRSCGGATTEDFTSPQVTDFGQVPPQFDALHRNTQLVTVGMGGNDFDVFGTLVGYCPTVASSDPDGSPCRDAMRNADGSDRLLSAVDQTEGRLIAAVREIRRRSPKATVVMVGYPQIPPRTGTCEALPLAAGDYRYALKVNRRLTDALHGAAQRTKVEYLNVWKASKGHDICSDDPWINGPHVAEDAAPFHPFPQEQLAIGRMLARQLG